MRHGSRALLGGYRGALLLLVVVFLASHLPLITGRALPHWDAGSFYAPAQMHVAETARQGRLVLWNPWINGGVPDAADPQVGAFSPLNVLLGALTGGRLVGFVAYALLVWALGGIGVLLLGRHLGAPAWGAAAAALAYVASGIYVGHAQHTSFQISFSALPFLVWRLDAALMSRRSLPAVQAGALWGLSALSGYPGLSILNGAYLALWALGRALRDPGRPEARRPSWRRTISSLVVVAGIGTVVLAPTWAAFFLEGRGYTDRSGPLPREVATASNALHPGALTTLASPYVAVLDVLDPELWARTDASSASLYLPAGIVVLALCSLGFAPVRRGGWRWGLAALAALALGCALGDVLPLRGWLYDLLAPLRYFRHAAIFRAYALFTVVVLALLASRDLACQDPARRRWRIGASIATASLAAAATSLALVARTADIADTRFLPATKIALALWAAVAALFALAARGLVRERLAVAGLLAVVALDAWGAAHLSRVFLGTRNAEVRAGWSQALAARVDDEAADDAVVRRRRSRFGNGFDNRNLLAREPALESYSPFANRFHRRWLREPVLVAAALGRDRFWLVPGSVDTAIVLPWTSAGFDAFAARTRQLGGMPIVLHRRAELAGGEAAPAPWPTPTAAWRRAQSARVEILRYEPELVELAVDAPADSLLLVTDRYARGWRAELDSRAVEVHPANFLFRAVAVPAGRHHLRMTYRPAGHPWLLFASWGTLASIIFASTLDARRRRSIL